MMTINKWYSLCCLLLSLFTLAYLNFLNNNLFKLETSVWCHRISNQTKFCKFNNICYDSEFKAFLFFLGKSTVIKGFSNYSELQRIQLSSIQEHNNFYANLSMIESGNYQLEKEIKIYPKSLLFSRFKPNNLMHTIHDDVFPLFLTLEFVCFGNKECMESYGLIFHDNYQRGPFFYLYNLFSKHPFIVLNELQSYSTFILCFREMLTGLITDGIFYQYGFNKPHGPVSPLLVQADVLRFTKFLINKLHISNTVSSNSQLVLINRVKSRRILNVEEVKRLIKIVYEGLNKKININVVNLDLYMNNITDLIKVISQADGLIGMHGAEMILSLFLKPKSFVIEIFPFGIKPEVVSFIKPISELEGSNFMYYSWRNKLKNNSVANPNAHPLFGGISHLSEAAQIMIKNTQEVPPVECCNNPLFLYHMYQDTIITNKFANFLHDVVVEVYSASRNSFGKLQNWFYPYIVSNVSCSFDVRRRMLFIRWSPPFNVKNSKDLWYSLYIKDKKGVFMKDFSTIKVILEIEIHDPVGPEFEIWISVHLKNIASKSPDLYIICNQMYM